MITVATIQQICRDNCYDGKQPYTSHYIDGTQYTFCTERHINKLRVRLHLERMHLPEIAWNITFLANFPMTVDELDDPEWVADVQRILDEYQEKPKQLSLFQENEGIISP